MQCKVFFRGCRITAIALFVIAALLPVTADAAALRDLSLEEMSKAADVIAVGTVESKEAAWVGRHIETSCRIKASEYWKGDLGSEFNITMMGGEVFEPIPVAMHTDGAPRFFEGERIVLFLEGPKIKKGEKKPDTKSRIPFSHRVVGWAQGKFTVLQDPESGEDRVVRIGLENVRILDKRVMNKRAEVAAKIARAKKENKKPGDVKSDQSAQKNTSENIRKKLTKYPEGASSSASLRKVNSFDLTEQERKTLNLSKRKTLKELKAKVLESLK